MSGPDMSKSMKWIVAGLALSLAANVFFIGFTVGKRVFGSDTARVAGPPPDGGLNMRALGQYLSADDKEAAQKLLMDNRRLLREKAVQMRQNQRQIRDLLTAETIDFNQLTQLLDQHDKLVSETHMHTRRLVLEFVATLDVETRRSLAKDLFKKRRPPSGGGDRRDRRRRGPDGERDFDRPPPPDEF